MTGGGVCDGWWTGVTGDGVCVMGGGLWGDLGCSV